MNQAASPVTPVERIQRFHLEARGIVQGVGFRPQACRVASELGLSGWVQNHGDGVAIEVEGSRASEYAERLRATLPPLASLDSLEQAGVDVSGERGFVIRPSVLPSPFTDAGAKVAQAAIPADVGLCEACLSELFDPDNRRYLHPFIACCDCGPRYTMTQRLPYDRENTSMAAFGLCTRCQHEYEDIGGRRLHAEPVACHDCGPRLSHPITQVAEALVAGQIVALKGVGGYHLCCDASNEAAVTRLRERKRRDARPLAVMVLNTASAARHVQLSTRAQTLLESAQRPIVIADRRSKDAVADGGWLAEGIAPGLGTLGVMLPYTAIHYLLFHALLGQPQRTDWLERAHPLALVMTSANLSGEPMLAEDAAALRDLKGIADLIVTHDREIARGCDDSVLRATDTQQIMLRRSRGFAPAAVVLDQSAPPVLALGAHLKNTLCASREQNAFLSPHIGDLDSPAMQALLRRSVGDTQDWLQVKPEAIACDLHPDYASTRLAQHLAETLDLPLIRVQHHHAHIGAVLASCRHDGPALGLALDGHGMGSDGASWGGELLLVEGATIERLGHFQPLPIPGGDRAAREPWRIALAVAASLNRGDGLKLQEANPLRDAVLALARSPECASSTACGRYFDAAASMLGLCDVADFEAAAPMRLESWCAQPCSDSGLFTINNGQLNLTALFDRLIDTPDPRQGAALFHGTLIDALADWAATAAETTGIRDIALGGGCFANRWLADCLPAALRQRGMRPLINWQTLSPGDGSVSLGQAWVAQHHLNATADREVSLRSN